ncbi:DUF5995 family protein [Ulvibacter litoralis]|uniref:Uncharacterized protein n=1 Tax=Ulvibacter litoralis TaxID=227084 RepID=A0A1G7DKA8_9FLAO|nr:DUF5995 family protein [Ulvibacter litoralis]GHC43121.1 hypothetical protein GCM10008083_01800 [Ulvibacter litoralis]SDE51932.1 hypothetical protein SAMN05421855_1011032 [Ulvibacter litoralis]
MIAKTIDEVIAQLHDIIAVEASKNSQMAFFPILYKKVTERIKVGIQNNEFENNVRMETLDVLFANRYIAAYRQYSEGKTPTISWKNAFEATRESSYLIMQHLLLGINAHINLDLGIAVAETVGDQGDLTDFENDFNKINDILASMIDDVQQRIGKVSPLFYLLEKVGKGKEDKIVSFSINIARDGAWLFANQYHISPNKLEEIASRDTIIGFLATQLTTTKSWLIRHTIKTIRFFETKDTKRVISVLGAV